MEETQPLLLHYRDHRPQQVGEAGYASPRSETHCEGPRQRQHGSKLRELSHGWTLCSISVSTEKEKAKEQLQGGKPVFRADGEGVTILCSGQHTPFPAMGPLTSRLCGGGEPRAA